MTVKNWAYDEKVQKGDLFVVTATDHNNNNNYTEGDFYKALFDGVIGSQYFPYHGQSNDNWKFIASSDWYHVTDIAMSADANDIYANGLNMVPVYIYMTPLNPGGKNIDVAQGVLIDSTWLIDYETGEKLIWTHAPTIDDFPKDSGWYYCQYPNDFINNANDSSINTDVDTQKALITFYVFARNVTNLPKKIGVLIRPSANPDDGQVIDTIYGKDSPCAVVTLAAKMAQPFSGSDLDVKKEIRFEDFPAQNPPVPNGPTNSLYVYTWTIPSKYVIKHWEWTDPSGSYTWAQSCYYKTGVDGGSERSRWLAAGSIFPPGNYDDLWTDMDIGLSEMLHTHYSINTGNNQLIFTRIIGKGFSWVYDISGLDRGHAVIITDQYGTRYEMLFHAGYETSDPYLTSSVV